MAAYPLLYEAVAAGNLEILEIRVRVAPRACALPLIAAARGAL